MVTSPTFDNPTFDHGSSFISQVYEPDNVDFQSFREAKWYEKVACPNCRGRGLVVRRDRRKNR